MKMNKEETLGSFSPPISFLFYVSDNKLKKNSLSFLFSDSECSVVSECKRERESPIEKRGIEENLICLTLVV
jgi:hypothetical protein